MTTMHPNFASMTIRRTTLDKIRRLAAEDNRSAPSMLDIIVTDYIIRMERKNEKQSNK